MIIPKTGQSLLLIDQLIVLDGTTYGVSEWELPREKLIQVGDNNQALFTFEYYGAGPGIASAELFVQRTAMYGTDEEEFESMNAAIALSAGHNWTNYSFGRNGAATETAPMGLMKLLLRNTHATSEAIIRLRAWLVMQSYLPMRVDRPAAGRGQAMMGREPMRVPQGGTGR